jgi:glycyl-tRNA synthetase beta chain
MWAQQQGSYEQRLSSIAALRPVIDGFFDNVMVNHPDQDIRRNRLAFLRSILADFSRIADFTEIVTTK